MSRICSEMQYLNFVKQKYTFDKREKIVESNLGH